MAKPDPVVERMTGLLVGLGPIEARRLFSGFGLYREDVIFALVFDGTLFLKGDGETKAAYEAAGFAQFIYDGRRGPVGLPYWALPKSLLKDRAALIGWARQAVAAGQRAHAAKARKVRPKRAAAEADAAPLPGRRRRAPPYDPDF